MMPRRSSDSGIALRLLRPGDARPLAALLAGEGEAVREWLSWPSETLTRRGLRRVIRDAARELGRSGAFLAGIRRDDELVGLVGVCDVDPVARRAHIAYWVARPHRGRGLATAACRLVAAHAFAVMRLDALELRCRAANAPARALAERLGFHLAGECRERSRDGRPPAELLVFRLVAAEWHGKPADQQTSPA
jgi:ribosomal-protein-serine acetyltransferase